MARDTNIRYSAPGSPTATTSGILMGLQARSDEDARHFEDQWKRANGEHVYR